MASDWGFCKDWWQLEPDAKLQNTTMASSVDEKLQPFKLRVSGDSGCTRYQQGAQAHAAGSSEAPPAASPQR